MLSQILAALWTKYNLMAAILISFSSVAKKPFQMILNPFYMDPNQALDLQNILNDTKINVLSQVLAGLWTNIHFDGGYFDSFSHQLPRNHFR